MAKTNYSMVLIGLIGIAALVVFISLPSSPPGDTFDFENHPAVGLTLPQVELMPLTGPGEPTILDDLIGKVVVLNFWATWCGPCVEELPDMTTVQREFRDRGDFRLLAVSCDAVSSENVERLRSDTAALLSELDLDLPTYTDANGLTRGALNDIASFDAYPTTILLDRTGTIRGVHVGATTKAALRREVLRLLSE